MLETRVIRGSKKVEGMREKNAGKTIVQRLSTTGSWNDTLKGLYSFLSSFFKFQSFDVQVVIPVFFFFFRFVNCSPFSFFSFTFFPDKFKRKKKFSIFYSHFPLNCNRESIKYFAKQERKIGTSKGDFNKYLHFFFIIFYLNRSKLILKSDFLSLFFDNFRERNLKVV